jgi:hypothetical protein
MDGFELNTNHYKPRKRRSIGIILVVILLLVGVAVGVWFWRQRDIDSLQKRLQATTETTPIVNNSAETVADPADTTKWNQFILGPVPLANDKPAGFSFKLPPAWTAQNCGTTDVLAITIAPNASSQANCGSEYAQSGPIVISAQSGDGRKNYRYNDSAIYDDFKSEEVVINDKDFELNNGVIKKSQGESGYPAGSTITSYTFFDEAQSVTYASTYVKIKDDPNDLSADFKLLIEKTFLIRDNAVQ